MVVKKARDGAKAARPKTKRARRETPPPNAARAQASEPVSTLPFVVGIGASAGGLEALETFFGALPADTGMAFVVVTHQHPEQPSMLPELLARRTQMRVVPASDGIAIQANHVFVSSPGANLALLHGVLHRMENLPATDMHLPIDYFFRSLARDQEERALCIVLSGTGTDGTMGLRAIKAHGGVAMVQDETSAHYAGMPQSAAETRLADHVLRPDQMPARLVALAHAGSAHAEADAASPPEDLKAALPKIFVLLRTRTGHDFSGYKPSTMERRIERRMRVHQLQKAMDYVHMLQAEPHELALLFQELLITVTQFFRDPKAFEALHEHLEAHLRRQTDPVSLRIWVPGCSTGEEAYSLAMLAFEAAESAGKHLHLQIFATDLDAQALEVGRAGVYPAGIAADVSAERLQRYFVADAKGYHVQKRLRDCVVFATQNMLRDPPFTKLDLLSCRNLLIYLTSDLQQRVFPLFHYAIKPGGLLWLGSSETATSYAELFENVDRMWKLYQRRDTLGSPAPMYDLHRSAELRETIARIDMSSTPRHGVERAAKGIAHGVEQVLIERFTPATLIVTDHGDIAYIHGRTGAFLEPSRGVPRHNLFTMAREGLRLCLQSALRRAATDEREIVQRRVSVNTQHGIELVTVIVRRIQEPEALRGLYRVSFVVRSAKKGKVQHKSALPIGGVERTHYERELQQTRDSLHGTLNELQTSNEELKSTNEELQSANEELQSSNEELETSREEMQALNEELQTLNMELQLKVGELAQVNDDMQNLLNATDIATLFLDRQLRIKRFTEQARSVVRLIESDVGRPIADLVSKVRYEKLTEHAQLVLDTLVPRDTEVQSLDGHWVWVRIRPYRTSQNVIDGVVITFVDIDRLKRAEELAAANTFAESIVQIAREPLVVLDCHLRVVTSNRSFSRLFDLDASVMQGQSLFELARGAFALPKLRTLLEAALQHGEPIEAFELTLESDTDAPRRLELNARRLEELRSGAVNAPFVLAAMSAASDLTACT